MSHLVLPRLISPQISTPRMKFISIKVEDEIVSPTLASVPIEPTNAGIIPQEIQSRDKIVRTYEEIKETLKPFDLVFFKGADFISNSIRKLEKINDTRGEFSHVGMVINIDILPCIKNSRPGEWYIWESTMSDNPNRKLNDGVPDIETGKGYFGTQIRSLDAIVAAYSTNPKTEIAFASLLHNPITQKLDESNEIYAFRIQQLKKHIRDTYEQFNHRIYDANLINLFSTIVPFCRCLRNCRRNESFFCSELVSIIYKKIEIFPWYLNEEDITPETLLSRRFFIKNYIRDEAKSLYENAEFPAILQYPPVYVTKLDAFTTPPTTT